jgi:hypothetical protein
MEANDLIESELARAEAMRDELDAWMASVIASLNGDDYK